MQSEHAVVWRNGKLVRFLPSRASKGSRSHRILPPPHRSSVYDCVPPPPCLRVQNQRSPANEEVPSGARQRTVVMWAVKHNFAVIQMLDWRITSISALTSAWNSSALKRKLGSKLARRSSLVCSFGF